MRVNNCLVCKKSFTCYYSTTRIQKYCGYKCYHIDRKGKATLPEYLYFSKCEECGNKFKKCKPSKRKRFCSKDCRLLAMKKYFTGMLRPYMTGVLHPNWQGGKTKEQELLRKSIEYKLWRLAVYERDHYKCVICGDNKGGNLEADHIKPFAKYPELRFELSNGRTLCHDCHSKTPTYLTGSFRDKDTGRYRSNFI